MKTPTTCDPTAPPRWPRRLASVAAVATLGLSVLAVTATAAIAATAAPNPVLGSKGLYPTPPGAGWGLHQPTQVADDANPYNSVTGIVWTGWGKATSQGQGQTRALTGTAIPTVVRVTLRASNLGRCSGSGPLAYRSLEIRYPPVAGTGKSKFQQWLATRSICAKTVVQSIGAISNAPIRLPAAPRATTPTVPPQVASGSEFLALSGSISCQITANAASTVHGREPPFSTQAFCQATSRGTAVVLNPDGDVIVCTRGCIGNPGLGTPTVPAHSSMRVSPFLCTALTTAVRCTIANGDGFTISLSGITHLGRGRFEHKSFIA